jgi:hypothetical protein
MVSIWFRVDSIVIPFRLIAKKPTSHKGKPRRRKATMEKPTATAFSTWKIVRPTMQKN